MLFKVKQEIDIIASLCAKCNDKQTCETKYNTPTKNNYSMTVIMNVTATFGQPSTFSSKKTLE